MVVGLSVCLNLAVEREKERRSKREQREEVPRLGMRPRVTDFVNFRFGDLDFRSEWALWAWFWAGVRFKVFWDGVKVLKT